jgi:hypothetical protein
MPLPGKPIVVSSRALQNCIGTLSLLDAGRVTEKAGQKLYKLMFTREGSNRNKPKQDLFWLCFGLFRCFKPISKLLKQTELFRNKPKQP